jgi:cytoskeletal protein RodZ
MTSLSLAAAQQSLSATNATNAASAQLQPADLTAAQASLAQAQAQVRRLAKELEAPDGPTAVAPSPRQQAAATRAARERQERLVKAMEELPKVRAARSKEPEEARVSTTDPEARVMKMADGGFRPACNVEFATDCAHQIILGVDVTNSGSDMGQLLPMQAVAK